MLSYDSRDLTSSKLSFNLGTFLQEWEPPTARHGALLDSLQKTRLVSILRIVSVLMCVINLEFVTSCESHMIGTSLRT